MTPSQWVASVVEQHEFLDASDHTFSSALSCGDWDLSDHSDFNEELDHPHYDAKTVTFGKVRIRSYPMILGDNPSCSKGLPVTLDWKSFGPTEEFDLNFIDGGHSFYHMNCGWRKVGFCSCASRSLSDSWMNSTRSRSFWPS